MVHVAITVQLLNKKPETTTVEGPLALVSLELIRQEFGNCTHWSKLQVTENFSFRNENSRIFFHYLVSSGRHAREEAANLGWGT